MNEISTTGYPSNGAMNCDLNYKAMYNELFDKHKEACDERDWLRDELRDCEAKKDRLEAQLEIVFLIFGGVNRG